MEREVVVIAGSHGGTEIAVAVVVVRVGVVGKNVWLVVVVVDASRTGVKKLLLRWWLVARKPVVLFNDQRRLVVERKLWRVAC